jgi:D-sedoheptulose 7-phosphate isomerase
MLMSTSGRSPNLLAAARAGRKCGLTCWAMTGPVPNPLAKNVDDVLGVPCGPTPCIQDAQQVAVHLLCLAFELAADDG